MIVKAECNRLGTNLRFIVTDRLGAGVVPQAAYDDYAERGDPGAPGENRNKELKTELLGDRLSCHRFAANYFRTRFAGTRLHAAALNLLIRLRRVVADPPSLTTSDDRSADAVPVVDPTLPVEALGGDESRRAGTAINAIAVSVIRLGRATLRRGESRRAGTHQSGLRGDSVNASHSDSPARPLASSAMVPSRVRRHQRSRTSCASRFLIARTA